MILYLLPFITSAIAATVVSGWVIDNECWKQPNHVGFDAAKLDTAPQDHYVHCLLLKRCKDSGFFLRANVTGTLANVGSLDAAGNAAMISFLESLPDRRNVYVAVEADVTGTGESATLANVVSIKASTASDSTTTSTLVAVSNEATYTASDTPPTTSLWYAGGSHRLVFVY